MSRRSSLRSAARAWRRTARGASSRAGARWAVRRPSARAPSRAWSRLLRAARSVDGTGRWKAAMRREASHDRNARPRAGWRALDEDGEPALPSRLVLEPERPPAQLGGVGRSGVFVAFAGRRAARPPKQRRVSALLHVARPRLHAAGAVRAASTCHLAPRRRCAPRALCDQPKGGGSAGSRDRQDAASREPERPIRPARPQDGWVVVLPSPSWTTQHVHTSTKFCQKLRSHWFSK